MKILWFYVEVEIGYKKPETKGALIGRGGVGMNTADDDILHI